MREKRSIRRRILALFLAAAVTGAAVGGNAVAVFAVAQEENRSEEEAPEETNEEAPQEAPAEPAEEVYHTEAYHQPAQTDSLPGWPQAPAIEAGSAVVIDPDNGAILYSKNADVRKYPASITKILTCLLACENLDKSMVFEMTASAAYGIEPGSSSIYGDTGEIFTVEQAIMALMLESANEMALMLGELTSGSEKKFVEKMNARTRAIGCTGTHFNNPNGLPDTHHYTTAGDMARIAYTCWVNPEFRRYVTTGYYEIPPTNIQKETRYMLNHHKMMEFRDYAYPGVLGGKTGYTDAAGNTLITYATQGDLSVAVAVLDGIGGAYADTAALLDYAFGNFKKVAMWNLPRDVDSIRNKNLPCDKYILKNLGDVRPFYTTQYRINVTLPEGVANTSVKRKMTLTKNAAGMPYLINQYTYEGNPVGTVKVYERKVMQDLLITDPFH